MGVPFYDTSQLSRPTPSAHLRHKSPTLMGVWHNPLQRKHDLLLYGRFYFDWGHFLKIGFLQKFLNRFFNLFFKEFKQILFLIGSEKYVRKFLQSFSPIGFIFSNFIDDFRFSRIFFFQFLIAYKRQFSKSFWSINTIRKLISYSYDDFNLIKIAFQKPYFMIDKPSINDSQYADCI